MNSSLKNSTLVKLFKANEKFIEPRVFPRLREILEKKSPTDLPRYYKTLSCVLARNPADARALINEIMKAPAHYRIRAMYVKLDAERMLRNTNVIHH